ncbi:hypothetical protein OpiT1DRAFT_02737 [Opitutaceae bacterium TAV1]|nr:hypothetical protein OpiT1DRAFT_02737 [Opitutaceae bacterium TAV1]
MKPNKLHLIAVVAAAFHVAAGLSAATWHADVVNGNDANAGNTRAAAFATLQRAIDAAQAGDTVIAHPGIYHENLVFHRGGTADAPIRIRADRVERDRVIITSAERNIREKRITWELVDPDLGLYRVPLGHRPTRILANRIDLLNYPTLADLRAFRFLGADYLGHKHGFAWDPASNHLYIRLRPDGRYGPTDPNADAITFAVSPPTGGGLYGSAPTKHPGNFNLAFRFSGPAHVVIDGFTFETPGVAGIYTAASDLVIRNNWFYGCRRGITSRRADRVLVENNYFTQYPAFADIEDITPAEAADQRSRKNAAYRIIHWQRKGNNSVGRAYSYEAGAIGGVGDAWEIRNNHFYDMFEALSNGSIGNSTNANIHHNRFERIVDNAIETEDHARNLRIHHNLIIDTFEPFSWQPLGGPPLPGPVFIHDNVVLQTPRFQTMSTANTGGVFKIGIRKDIRYWSEPLPGEVSPPTEAAAPGGFWVAHNTIFAPLGRILTQLNSPEHPLRGFYFFNNILTARKLSYRAVLGGIFYDGNVVRFQDISVNGLAVTDVSPSAAAGLHGISLPPEGDTNGLRLPLDETNAFAPFAPGSPLGKSGVDTSTLRAAGIPDVPAALPLRPTPGAAPLSLQVGPQPRDEHP